MYVSALNMRSDWFFLVLRAYQFLTDNSRQFSHKDQQESCAMAEKLHDAVVKFDTYRNLQRHRAVLPATARLLPYFLYILYRYSVFGASILGSSSRCPGRSTRYRKSASVQSLQCVTSFKVIQGH